jgi:hypothetical protein
VFQPAVAHELAAEARHYRTFVDLATHLAGGDRDVSITFAAAVVETYAITFTETGLATGTNWSVTIGSTTVYSDHGTTVTFQEQNGSYGYQVNPVSGYKIEQATGTVQVTGQNQSLTVTFAAAPATFTLTFTESGLPSGTNWSVTIGSVTHYSDGGTSVTFLEANGNYSYTIGSVNGYSASPASGPVTLTGANTAVNVAFTSTGSPGTSSTLSTLDWGILGIVIAVIVIALVLALVMRGRGGAGRSPPAEESSTPEPEPVASPAPWSEEEPTTPGSSP